MVDITVAMLILLFMRIIMRNRAKIHKEYMTAKKYFKLLPTVAHVSHIEIKGLMLEVLLYIHDQLITLNKSQKNTKS